jgi:hypothetical protein
MNISDIIVLVENRLRYLESNRVTAISYGDAVQINILDKEIFNTQQTLEKLKILL